MKSKIVENAIIRYLNGAAQKDDLDLLNYWIENSSSFEEYKDYLKTQFLISMSMSDPNLENMKEELLSEIRKEKYTLGKRRKRRNILKYAAVVIFVIGLSQFYGDHFFSSKNGGSIVSGDDVITLEREDGDMEILQSNESFMLVDNEGSAIAEHSGQELTYIENKNATKLEYNTLRIPYGKQLRIKLSDGTKVMLNAGSEFSYPISFINGKKRQVFLTGEAYFDVAHDSINPFIVNAHELNIEVLGTEFNIANYEEDAATEVVLVQGSVLLQSDQSREKSSILVPGQKAIFQKSDRTIQKKDVNTSIYTAWTNGLVVFRHAPFANIIKKLERHYNVKIHNYNTALAKEEFNATIDVESESIKEILEYFNKIYGISYSIKNNEVIIN